jgi:iron complex outermembrane receptor protein
LKKHTQRRPMTRRAGSRAARPKFSCGALATAIGLILATGTNSARATDQSSPPANQGSTETLEEVTVTAQRREQTVQDVPYNISVLSSGELDAPTVSTASDIAKLVPGLLTVDTGPAARGNDNSFILRGLRTDNPGSVDYPGQTVSPVSTYFGETPIFLPLVLRDLDHVEVLVGPQGTLYGSGSEAGTIRFMPNRPKFDEFSAEISTDASKTENAGSFNNRFDAVLNIPITSELALRIVGGEEHLHGFIDDVGLGVHQGASVLSPPTPRVSGDPTSGFTIAAPLRDANTSDQSYGRAALRWDPAQGMDFELTYLYQKTAVADAQYDNVNWAGGTQNLASGYTGPVPPFANSSYSVPAGGDYRNTALIQQPYINTVNLESLVGTVDVGFATFTSATSAYQERTQALDDNTYQWYIPGGTNFLTYYNNYPRTIAVEQDIYYQRAFVQELRLVSNGKNMFDYVVGAFFERQTGDLASEQWFPGVQQYYSQIGAVSANPQYGDTSLLANMETTFTDRAAFGELTWHITPAWQVTGGARFFSQSFVVGFNETLPFCGSTCGNSDGEFFVHNAEDDHNHLFKLNTSYDLSSQTKVYATFSEGFRRGGATGLPPVGIYASEPQYFTFRPDFAKNYEVGVKGTGLDSRVSYTADLFLVNLTDFQFDSYSPSGLPAVYNGSKARSKGGELQANFKLTPHLTGSLGYSYTQATVTQSTNIYDLPAFGGPGSTPVLTVAIPEGTRLPGVPRSVVTAAADYRLPIGATNWSATWHLDGIYRTSAPGSIPGVYVSGWNMPSAKMIDAVIGLDNGRQWSIDMFGTNLTSDPNFTGAVGVQGSPANTLNYRDVTRPRTLGVSLKYRFN